MFDGIFLVLALLFVKHWYIDFVNQTMAEVHGKGIYGNLLGIWHCTKQCLGTAAVLWFLISFEAGLVFGIIDAVIHYHVDWSKININKKYNYTVENPKFWMWLGLDQLAHSLTYVWIVWCLL